METQNHINDQVVEIFFFPFVGGGHQIPMIDMARLFASHGAKSTIVTTPTNYLSFHNSIARDQSLLNLHISIHALHVPDDLHAPDTDTSAAPSTDTSMLEEPLKLLLLDRRPHCIVHDVFHRWSAEAIDSTNTPRVTFTGGGCFASCVQDCLSKYKPQDKAGSDYEPFVVPGMPHRIELTRSQLPGLRGPPRRREVMARTEERSFGVLVNSFYDLEGVYVDHFRTQLGNKAWLVGPVSLCNLHQEDKAERGKRSSLDERSILTWLDGKPASSVLYVSFGSLARLAPEQLLEIANGLEASECSFVWVVGEIMDRKGEENEVNWLPGGFEQRLKERGLILRGWAPQLLILEHSSVGGFMTHCGWNSTVEGLTAAVPMITWPYSAEQFTNEKLLVDVVKVGTKVGSLDWASWSSGPKRTVGRDKVEAAVRRLMGGGEEVAEMRRRAREMGEKARRAVGAGGSSFKDVDGLIEELKAWRKMGIN